MSEEKWMVKYFRVLSMSAIITIIAAVVSQLAGGKTFQFKPNDGLDFYMIITILSFSVISLSLLIIDYLQRKVKKHSQLVDKLIVSTFLIFMILIIIFLILSN